MNDIYFVCQNIITGEYSIQLNSYDSSIYRMIGKFDSYTEANYYICAFLK